MQWQKREKEGERARDTHAHTHARTHGERDTHARTHARTRCIHMRTRVCVTDWLRDVESKWTWTPSWPLRAMSCKK